MSILHVASYMQHFDLQEPNPLLALNKLMLLNVVVKIVNCLHDQIEWFPRGGPCTTLT